MYYFVGLYLSLVKLLLKASDSLIKNPTYYNILEFVPKNHAKANLSAARSQLTVILNLPQAKVPLKASVTSGR